MPILDGIETTRRLTADHPDVAVVILTTFADDTPVLAALRAGARGYLTKTQEGPISPAPCMPPPVASPP